MSSDKGKQKRIELATILLTHDELPKKWFEKAIKQLPKKVGIQLFFTGNGTLLVGENLPKFKFHDLTYCSYSHRKLKGPKPLDGINAGGLFDLGTLVSESRYVLSIPRSVEEPKQVKSRLKEIGVILDSEKARGVEGLRVATGLAGCNHRVTLFFPSDGFPFIADVPKVPLEAKPFLETLSTLGARFSTTPASFDDTGCDILLSI